jgi:hypothetical protein
MFMEYYVNHGDARGEIITFPGRKGCVVPATQGHGAFVADALREEDRLELVRFYPWEPREVIRRSLLEAEQSWAGLDEHGDPVAIWGVASSPSSGEKIRCGVPWMLATTAVRGYLRELAVFSRHFDREMCRRFGFLGNCVDASYSGAIRWLEWLGYSRGKEVVSDSGYPFILMCKYTSQRRPT